MYCLVFVDREERSFNQTLRQQQDEAYRESLRADQEKVLWSTPSVCCVLGVRSVEVLCL